MIVAVQQLEGNVFYPVVVGRKLQLHPVGILLALTAGGVLAGVVGAFLAVPIAAVTGAVLQLHARAPRGAPELSRSGAAVGAAWPSRSRRAGG